MRKIMISYIHVKNFKSFGDVYINFKDKNLKVKNLILVYGENGIGKSNFTDIFDFLSLTSDTMDVRDFIQELIKHGFEKENVNQKFIMNKLKEEMLDMEQIIKKYKMIDSDDHMYVEYGFLLNDDEGKYIMEFDDKSIIYECLEYRLQRRRGRFFEIKKDKVFLSPKVFVDAKATDELKNIISQFWGKHTFLSILKHEYQDKADHYFDDKISRKLYDIINDFDRMTVLRRNVNDHRIRIHKGRSFNINRGEIKKSDEDFLDQSENMINTFLSSVYDDIEEAVYKRDYEEDSIHYQLLVKKKIYGKVRTLKFFQESTGVRASVMLMLVLLGSMKNDVIVIDEFDTGIHDRLVKDMIMSIADLINGQLILTTHNTGLMESGINKESFYVINKTADGNKEIECILRYDNKINPKTNIRRQYLNGTYRGVPKSKKIDYQEIIKENEEK